MIKAILFLALTWAYDAHVEVDIRKSMSTVEHIVEEGYRLKITNKTQRNLNQVKFRLEENAFNHLRIIQISDAYRNITQTSVIESNNFVVKLDTPKLPNESFSLHVKLYYYNILAFKPYKIKLREDQYVELVDNINNLVLDDIFTINHFEAGYLLYSKAIEYSKKNVMSHREMEGGYHEYRIEPYLYDKIRPFKNYKVRFYFMMNKPFDVFLNTEREIYISMWGNVFENNRFYAMNQAAEIDGEYSNIDFFAGDFQTGKNSLRWISTNLPGDLWGLSITDEVGNVTKPYAAKLGDAIKLNLIPRFSLFGGWKSNWFVSYNQKLRKFIKRDTNDHSLYKLSYPIGYEFDLVLSEKFVLKVCLPEFAEVINIDTKFDYISKSVKREYGLFELFGQECHEYQFINVLPFIFDDNFEITFRYKNIYMYSKLFVLIGLITFLSAIVFVLARIDLRMEDRKADTKQKSG